MIENKLNEVDPQDVKYNNFIKIRLILQKHKVEQFLKLLIKRANIDSQYIDTLLQHLFSSESLSAWVIKNEWSNLLDIYSKMSTILNKKYKELLSKKKHQPDEFYPALKVEMENTKIKFEEDTKILERFRHGVTIEPGINQTLNDRETAFSEQLKDVLLQSYYIANGILKEMAIRPKTQMEKKVDSLKQSASTFPLIIGVIGGGIATIVDEGIISVVANQLGVDVTKLGAVLGAGIGKAAEYATRGICTIIGNKLDHNAQEKLRHVIRAFKVRGDRDYLDSKTLDAVVTSVVLRYRDQINALEVDQGLILARCMGQRIVTHIAHGRNEKIEPSSWISKRIENLKKYLLQDFIPNDKMPLGDRCLLALQHEKEIGTTNDYELQGPNERGPWIAAGVIDCVGIKTKQEPLKLYVRTKDAEEISWGRYGFAYVSSDEIIEYCKEKGFSENETAHDIFRPVGLLYSNMPGPPVLFSLQHNDNETVQTIAPTQQTRKPYR